eukprot:366412-Chlamydomonas_euryale.AAC.6
MSGTAARHAPAGSPCTAAPASHERELGPARAGSGSGSVRTEALPRALPVAEPLQLADGGEETDRVRSVLAGELVAELHEEEGSPIPPSAGCTGCLAHMRPRRRHGGRTGDARPAASWRPPEQPRASGAGRMHGIMAALSKIFVCARPGSTSQPNTPKAPPPPQAAPAPKVPQPGKHAGKAGIHSSADGASHDAGQAGMHGVADHATAHAVALAATAAAWAEHAKVAAAAAERLGRAEAAAAAAQQHSYAGSATAAAGVPASQPLFQHSGSRTHECPGAAAHVLFELAKVPNGLSTQPLDRRVAELPTFEQVDDLNAAMGMQVPARESILHSDSRQVPGA